MNSSIRLKFFHAKVICFRVTHVNMVQIKIRMKKYLTFVYVLVINGFNNLRSFSLFISSRFIKCLFSYVIIKQDFSFEALATLRTRDKPYLIHPQLCLISKTKHSCFVKTTRPTPKSLVVSEELVVSGALLMSGALRPIVVSLLRMLPSLNL